MRPQETPGTTVPDLARLVSFVDGNIGKLSVLGFLGMVPIGLAMLRDEQLAGGLGAIWYEIPLVVSLLLVLGAVVWTFRRYAYDYLGESSVSAALSRHSGRLLAVVLITVVANVFVYSLVPGLSERWAGLATQLLFGSAFFAGWLYRAVVSGSR